MVPQPIATTDEKELFRISSLEQRIIEFENTFFKTANATLKKRVVELETSLRELTQERDKLREIIATGIENVFIQRKKEYEKNDSDDSESSESSESSDGSEDSESSDDSSFHELTPSKKFEFESVYGRIWKLVENMKSDCEKAISQKKISTVSNLPKFPVKQNSTSISRPGTPKNQPPVVSSPARSRASSVSNISVPSRSNTPNGIKIPNVVNNSITFTKMQTPSRIQSLSPPDSQNSSRPNTPSSNRTSSNVINPINLSNNSLPHLNSKMPLRSRTPIWTSCTHSSRPSTPNNSKPISNTPNNTHNIPVAQSLLCDDITTNVPDDNHIIHSNIPSGLSSKSTSIPMYTPMTRKQAIV